MNSSKERETVEENNKGRVGFAIAGAILGGMGTKAIADAFLPDLNYPNLQRQFDFGVTLLGIPIGDVLGIGAYDFKEFVGQKISTIKVPTYNPKELIDALSTEEKYVIGFGIAGFGLGVFLSCIGNLPVPASVTVIAFTTISGISYGKQKAPEGK